MNDTMKNWPRDNVTKRPMAIGDLIVLTRPRSTYTHDAVMNKAWTLIDTLASGDFCIVIGCSEPDTDGDRWPIVICPRTGDVGLIWLAGIKTGYYYSSVAEVMS